MTRSLIAVLLLAAVGCTQPHPRGALHARWHLLPCPEEPSGMEDVLYLAVMNTGREKVNTTLHLYGREQCCTVENLEPGRITVFNLGDFACALPTDVKDCCTLPGGGGCTGVADVKYQTPTPSALPGRGAPPCTTKEESNRPFTTADPKCFGCKTGSCQRMSESGGPADSRPVQ